MAVEQYFLGPHLDRGRPARPRVLQGHRGDQDHRGPQGRRRRDGDLRADRAGGAEVHRQRVLGLPRRRIHLAGGDRRPDPGHRGDGALALRRQRPRLGQVFTAVRTSCWRSSPNTHSLSLQQTLFAMGKGALEAVPEIAEIRLSMPNKHHFLVDMTKWDLDNPNQVFYAADRPYGLIEASVLRDDAPGRRQCLGGHRRVRLTGWCGSVGAGAPAWVCGPSPAAWVWRGLLRPRGCGLLGLLRPRGCEGVGARSRSRVACRLTSSLYTRLVGRAGAAVRGWLTFGV